MYMALTEKEAEYIRSLGMQVIQFKHCIHTGTNIYKYALLKTIESFNDVIEAARKLWKDFLENFQNAIDDMKMVFDKIKDKYGYRTSRRYRLVKFFSKLGYDKRKLWVSTRRTWLARSNC